jgi:hypothetical protein
MGRQLAPVRRAQELLLADRTLQSVIHELKTCFGLSSTDAIAATVVGRSLNRFAGAEAGAGGRTRHTPAPRARARATASA